jgi:hypothetical protein
VSVVSGNAPESIAELQIKFGDLIARRGDLCGFWFVVGKNSVSCAFKDANSSSRPVTWKHAFSGPFKGRDSLMGVSHKLCSSQFDVGRSLSGVSIV